MQHLLLSLLLGLFLACNSAQSNHAGKESAAVAADSSNATSNIDTTLQGEWQLMPVLASDTAAGKLPWLNFDLSTSRFTGNTGCNSMSGLFIKNGTAFSFDEQIITTKMACEGYNESTFIENLLRTNNYKIENGVLMLMHDETILSKWARRVNLSSTKKV